MGKQGPKSINIINKARMGSAMQDGVNPPMLKSQGVPMAPSSPAKIAPLIGAVAAVAGRRLLAMGAKKLIQGQARKWLTNKGFKAAGKRFLNSKTGKFAKGVRTGKETTGLGKVLNFGETSFIRPFQSLGNWTGKKWASNVGRAADYISYGASGYGLGNLWGSEAKNNDGKLDNPSNTLPDGKLPSGVTPSTGGSGGYVKPGGKATGSMKDYAIGSDARKAEYDARGWKYDDTIKGYDRKGNKLNAAPDNRTAPKPNNNAWIKVNESKKVSNKVNNEISNVKVPDVPKVNANQSDNASNVSRKQIPFENPTNRKQIRVNKQFRKATGMDKKDIKTAKLEEKMNISGDGLGGRILSNRVINRYNRGMEAQVNVSPDKKPVGIKQDVKPVLEVKKQEVQKLAVDPIKVDVSSLKPRGELQTVEQANKAQDELDLKGTPFKRRGCGPRGLGSQYK